MEPTGINLEFVLPKKRSHMEELLSPPLFEKKQLEYFVYENAAVLPLKKIKGNHFKYGAGGVVSNNEFVEISGIEARYGGSYLFDNPEYKDCDAVYCGAYHDQWGHFLLESCSRLWFLLENRNISKYIFIVEENSDIKPEGNYLEFFQLLGIEKQIEFVNRPTVFRKLVVPELGYSRTHYFSQQYKRIFEVAAENAQLHIKELNNLYDRVYLSRSQFRKARLTESGLDMLDDYFSGNDFQILFPEKTSLSEVIVRLRCSTLCAAESGSLPHNFLFCKDGQQVLIIERHACINEMQLDVDVIKNLCVTYVDAHFTVYPANAGFGPYYLAYTRKFQDFSNRMGYSGPDRVFLSASYYKQNLIRFLETYSRVNGRGWGVEDWQIQYMDAYYESYQETYKILGPWLSGAKPLFLADYLKYPIRIARKIKKIFFH